MTWHRNPPVIFGVWLVVTLATGVLIWQEDRFFAVRMPIVGLVIETQKDVHKRGDSGPLWKQVSITSREIYDGDKISTGVGAQLVVDFGDGRIADIGQQSLLGFSSIRQTSGITLIISLFKGRVTIGNSKKLTPDMKTRFPIIIRSDGVDYQIKPDEQRGFIKNDSGVSELVVK